MRETWVQSLGWEDPLEEGMATHSSILAWRIPWIEEPGGLYTPRGHKESDTTEPRTTAQHRVGGGEVITVCHPGEREGPQGQAPASR